MSPPPPPPPPITNKNPNNNRSHLNIHLHQKPTSLPDLLFTALSLLFLFSSSSSSSSSSSFKIPPLCLPQNPRRLFLKNPIMSESNPNPNPSRHLFSSPLSLSNWLQSRLPSDSFSSWGIKPGTKNVHNLWLELSQGETCLIDSTPPIRTVHVVSVRIIDGNGRILLESHQELTDGTPRQRNRPLSEKMKPNETVEDAVVRAVQEELGSILRVENISSIVKIKMGSYQKKVEERVSVSYPGLPACYVLHTVDASVEGLPDDEFCTQEEEYSECSEAEVAGKAVHVKKHFWKWVGSDSV